MAGRRVTIQWTETAKRCLEKLPPKVRRGLLEKADALAQSKNPRAASKPLVGPLQGYYRITYGRYRAIYSVEEQALPNGDVLVLIRIRFVAAGIRKEGDRKDVYDFALRLLRLGVLDADEQNDEADGKD